MRDISAALLAIFSAIIGLSILSVLISRQSQTVQVIQAGSSALSSVIKAAVDPVATASTNGNLGENTFASPGINQVLPLFGGGLIQKLFGR